MVGTTTNPSSQEATVPGHPTIDWFTINEELASMLSPVHAELANNICSPREAAEEFVTLITAHLKHHLVIRPGSSSTQQIFQHRERAIVRLTKRLAYIKNNKRKNIPSQRSEFLNAVRAHNKSVKAMRELDFPRSVRKQEKAFRSNPWKSSVSL